MKEIDEILYLQQILIKILNKRLIDKYASDAIVSPNKSVYLSVPE